MNSLIQSLSAANVPFALFDSDGVPVTVSRFVSRALGPGHEDQGLEMLACVARGLALAHGELGVLRDFDIRVGARQLHIGAIVLLAATGRFEVLMVLSTTEPLGGMATTADSLLHRYFDDRQLTVREREVAEYVATGLPSPAIARLLGISVHTVRRHTERVFSKTGVRSRAELARYVSDLNSDSTETLSSNNGRLTA